jgi:hypothetical protein
MLISSCYSVAMYFAVNIHLYDALQVLQGIQQIVIVVALLIIGYFLLRKKKLSSTLKLLLWGLAVAWTIASVIVYAYNLDNYISNYRPIYEKENIQQTGLKY